MRRGTVLPSEPNRTVARRGPPRSAWPALGLALYAAHAWHARAVLVTEDSATCARDVLFGDLAKLLHPHHLLYAPLLRLAVALPGRALRVPDEVLVAVMRVTSVLATLAALWSFRALAIALGMSRDRAVLTAATLAACAAMVRYATEIEPYPLVLALAFMALAASVAPAGRRRSSPLILGTAFFAAMAVHQLGILLAPPLWVTASRNRPDAPRRSAAVAVLAPLCAIGLLYVAAAWMLGHRTPGDAWRWVTAYAHLGRWGESIEANRLSLAAAALTGFAVRRTSLPATRLVAAIAATAVSVLLVWTLAVLRRRPARTPQGDARALLVAASILPSAGFALWWDPGNVEFWMMPVAVSLLGASLAAPPPARLRRSLRIALAAAGIATLAWLSVPSRSERAASEHLAGALEDRTAAMTRGETVLVESPLERAELSLDARVRGGLREFRCEPLDPASDPGPARALSLDELDFPANRRSKKATARAASFVCRGWR